MSDNVVVVFLQEYYWVLIILIIVAVGLIGVVICVIRRCRRQPRCEYTALEDESLFQDRLEMDRKLQKDADRNMAMIQCQYYLRGSNRYVYIRQLADMGSRLGKRWFLVRDTTTKTERLLTMTPISESCPLRYSATTRQVLLELFLALQHPYIYPVLDIDCKVITEQEFIIAIIPFNERGSLKDLIYHSHCQDDWKVKYHFHGKGLEQAQVQRLGCQILEALLFLKDQGFPAFVHLHTGNVILQNGVARLSGLENVLFGHTSHHHFLMPKRLHDNREASEAICYGHLLFEMAAGYELINLYPSDKNYKDLESTPQVAEVVKFIFQQGHYLYPSIREIASLDFFRYVDLRELQSHASAPVLQAKLSPATRNLLKEVKRRQRSKRRNKRSQSMSTLETASLDSRDNLGSSMRTPKKKKKHTLSSSETIPSEMCGSQVQSTPLPDIGPSTSHGTASLSGSVEYFTPPTTPLPLRDATQHSLLLREIQANFRCKSFGVDHNPRV